MCSTNEVFIPTTSEFCATASTSIIDTSRGIEFWTAPLDGAPTWILVSALKCVLCRQLFFPTQDHGFGLYPITLMLAVLTAPLLVKLVG